MKISKELQKGSNITIILKLLENKAMYGYELIKVIELKSNTLFKFKEGTLYPILHSLEQEGAIESYWDSSNGRRRKYYKICEKGKLMLKEKEEEWNLFKGAIDSILNNSLKGV